MNWDFLWYDDLWASLLEEVAPHPSGPANGPFPALVCRLCSSSRHLSQKKSSVRDLSLKINTGHCKQLFTQPRFLMEGSSFEAQGSEDPPTPNPGFCPTNTPNKPLLEWHFYCSFPLVPLLELPFLQQQERGNRTDTLKTDTAGLDVSGHMPETLVLVCVVHRG